MANSSSGPKIVLVTGASSGFGMITSNLLAERGYRVFGASRNPSFSSKSSELLPRIELLQLDVNSDQSVNDCVKVLLQRTGGRFDVLVNNAGFLLSGGIEETSVEEAKMQLETNLFGVMRMARAVLPVMRKQRSGQIINLGSIAGYIPIPFQGYYAVSKFALEGFTETLRYETKRLGIKVSIVEPGFFRTNLAKAARYSSTKIDDYDTMRENAMAQLRKREEKGEDPKVVAETILRIIETDEPKLHYAVGRDKSAILLKRIVPQGMFEGQVRKIFKLDA